MNSLNPDHLIRAEILRLLPLHRTHVQLAQIERDDPEFPRPIILGAKRFYRREEIERWIAKKFGENAVTAPSEKPRKAAKRSSHVKRT